MKTLVTDSFENDDEPYDVVANTYRYQYLAKMRQVPDIINKARSLYKEK